MSVERSGIKLRQNEDLIKARIEAVTDRDIDQTILTSERYSRLTAVSGQRTEARAATSAHYNADDFSFFHRSLVIKVKAISLKLIESLSLFEALCVE